VENNYSIKAHFNLTLVKKDTRMNTLCLLLIIPRKRKEKKRMALWRGCLLDMVVVFYLNEEQKNVKN